MDRRAYRGIDCFRIIAALFVVAIHTSPLSSYSAMGDFIVTRIIARTAVPFFFMTTGFFLFYEGLCDAAKLKAFVKKTLGIYGLSVVFYLPINIYNHYFSMDNLLPNMIKDIVFDGTLYHLWYFPASVTGVVIVWYLIRRFGVYGSMGITLGLYGIGLLGDSYYGFAEKITFLKKGLEYIFQVSDYTRNGIFFAPVFIVLGAIAAGEKGRSKFPIVKICSFVISLSLMLCEGIALHRFGMQRHDSMYVMLLPCSFFLFCTLAELRGRRSRTLRSVALIVYIIHPMVIVAVRMVAGLLHRKEDLVENSLIHFAVVAVSSYMAAAVFALQYEHIRSKRACRIEQGRDRAWTEINYDNLVHNVHTIQNAMPEGCEMMAVVKADAYGHQAYEVAAYAGRAGVKAFAVATIDEGIVLRRKGIRGEILILGYTAPERARELWRYRLTATLVDYKHAMALSRQRYRMKAHIKVDTGMNRLGFAAEDVSGIAKIMRLNRNADSTNDSSAHRKAQIGIRKKKNLEICGIYTHLCVSDSLLPEDVEFTEQQIGRFYGLLEQLSSRGIRLPKIHIQSSYGLLNYPELACDYVRVGIALYANPCLPGERTKIQLDLRPVLALKARVVLVRDVQKGETVGYGREFMAKRDSRIALLSVGYADGVPRSLSSQKGSVLLHGKEAPMVGRICMDQLTVDVTDVPETAVGDIATLIGRDGERELTAPTVACDSGSIPNEILSRMGTRLGK